MSRRPASLATLSHSPHCSESGAVKSKLDVGSYLAVGMGFALHETWVLATNLYLHVVSAPETGLPKNATSDKTGRLTDTVIIAVTAVMEVHLAGPSNQERTDR